MSLDAQGQEPASVSAPLYPRAKPMRQSLNQTLLFFIRNTHGQPLHGATVIVNDVYVDKTDRAGTVRIPISNATFPLHVEVSAPGYQTVRTFQHNLDDIAEVKLEPLAPDSVRAERTVAISELSRDTQVSASKLQQEAVKALEKGDNSRAQELLSKALQLSPSSSTAYNNLGVALLRQGKAGKAMTCFEKAVDLAPYAASPSGNLGLLRWLQGRYDECYALLDRAVSLGFSSTVARNHLAILALQRGRFEQALQLLSSLKPEQCAGRDLYLYLCLRGLGSEQEASKAFQRYLSQNPVQLLDYNLGLPADSPLRQAGLYK